MTAIEDAIEAGKEAWRLHHYECNCGDVGHNATRIIRAVVEPGHLIAADDVEGLRAALLRLGALEQIGHNHGTWDRVIHSGEHGGFDSLGHYVGLVRCTDCPDCVRLYRFKGEQV